MLIVEAWKCW